MNLKSLSLKLAGGLFAVGIAATALAGQVAPASADKGPGPIIPGGSCLLGDAKPNIKMGGITLSKDFKFATITYQNDGACSTGTGFWISVRFNHQPGYVYLYQPAMAAGQTATKTVLLPNSMQGPGNGTREIDALLDYKMGFSPLSQIDESNENDNVAALFY